MFTEEEIERRFSYHKPASQDICNLHELVRRQCKTLATMLNDGVPSGREQSLAMTHLEEVMYWANAAIARTYAQKTVVPELLPHPKWKSRPDLIPENPNEVLTYRAEITMGMREGYSGAVHAPEELLHVCQAYCNEVGLGVEVHFGHCIYTGGSEPCARISLINYPRFPKDTHEVFQHAETLGKKLATIFKQQRFTIVTTDITRMYEL